MGYLLLSHLRKPVVIVQFSTVQLLSRVELFATPWTAARLASLSITNSQSLFKLIMSIELTVWQLRARFAAGLRVGHD